MVSAEHHPEIRVIFPHTSILRGVTKAGGDLSGMNDINVKPRVTSGPFSGFSGISGEGSTRTVGASRVTCVSFEAKHSIPARTGLEVGCRTLRFQGCGFSSMRNPLRR